MSDAVADSVVKRLGKSNRLLHIFAEHCSKKFEDTLDQRWVEIFRRVCFKFQENGGEVRLCTLVSTSITNSTISFQIGQLGQFFTFLRKLFREPLDLKDLKELYNALRKVIVSQTNLDERSFDEEQRDYYLRHPVSEAVQVLSLLMCQCRNSLS